MRPQCRRETTAAGKSRASSLPIEGALQTRDNPGRVRHRLGGRAKPPGEPPCGWRTPGGSFRGVVRRRRRCGCAAVPEWRTMLAAGFEAARREPSPYPRNVLRCSAAGLTTHPRRIRRRLRAETPVRTGQAGSCRVETMSADESTGASDSLSFRAKPEERAGERRFQLRNAPLSGSLPVRSSRGERVHRRSGDAFYRADGSPPCLVSASLRLGPTGP